MTHLQQKVHELNELFRATNAIAKQLQEQLRPMIGRKILRKDGVETKYLQRETTYWLPKLMPAYSEHYAKVLLRSLENVNGKLLLKVKVCFSGTLPGGRPYTNYHETHVALGRMEDNGVTLARLLYLELLNDIDHALQKTRIDRCKILKRELDRAYLDVHYKLRRGLK